MLPEPIQTATVVTSVLEQLKIPYFLGGSFASIVHGVVRTTQAADIIADMRLEHVQPFIENLQADFYIDEAMVWNAIQQRGSFNILHRQSIFKVDIFIARDRPFEKSQFSRARKHPLTEGHELQAVFAAAEDILLAKLEWYRLGGEVSERQWRDALGIVKIQGETLDQDYLRRWAEELSVSDLLEKILQQA